MFILSALKDGQFAFAVDNYLQLLGSITVHFIANDHWCWFDDSYSPNNSVSHTWEAPVPNSSALSGEGLAELEADLQQIEQIEAYQYYSYPSMILFFDLQDSKTIVEHLGSHR